MNSADNFHQSWKNFLNESKSDKSDLSEVDIVGGIAGLAKKLSGMGQRPKDRSLGGRTRMKAKAEKDPEEIEEMPPEETALVVRTVGALEKASSPKEVTDIMKSELFTDLYKTNPDMYDLVVNSVSKEKIDSVIQSASETLLSGNRNGFKQMLTNLKIQKANPVTSLIDRITGAFTPSNRKLLLSFDLAALNEEENKSSFNANLTKRVSQTFKLIPLQYQKYIIAQALIIFWKRVIDENTYEADDQEMMAIQTIAKLQSDWIKKNIDTQEVDASRNKNRSNLKKAANNPEVKALLTTQP